MAATTEQMPMPDQTSDSQQEPTGAQSPSKQAEQKPSHQPPHQQQARQPQGSQQIQQRWIDLSVVIPLFNEEESLRELHQQLRHTLSRMNMHYELLFIDDGSTDKSFQVLRDLKRRDKHVKIVRFRKNYGKSAALSVGFDKAQGNIVITLDADLQDDPAEFPALRRRLDEGFDLVSGWKKVRYDPLSKTLPSRLFNAVTRLLTGIPIHDFNCGLKIYKREVAKSIKVYGELHRYIPVLAHWEGFKVGEVPVRHRARKYGTTKFGMVRFWRGLLDLLTTLFTTRYMSRPLHLFGPWGLVMMVGGIIIDTWLVVEWFLGLTSLSNRPLFLIGIFLIIVGLQFISLGLLGEMITRSQTSHEEIVIREYIR